MAQVAPHRLTIRQIADLAGVSIATVSRVLNGRDDVAPETRDLVTRVIRENGYTANRSARGLSAGRTGLVGVLVPLIYPAYFSSILAGTSTWLLLQETPAERQIRALKADPLWQGVSVALNPAPGGLSLALGGRF